MASRQDNKSIVYNLENTLLPNVSYLVSLREAINRKARDGSKGASNSFPYAWEWERTRKVKKSSSTSLYF